MRPASIVVFALFLFVAACRGLVTAPKQGSSLPPLSDWRLSQDVVLCSDNATRCGALLREYWGAHSCDQGAHSCANNTQFLWLQGLPSGHANLFRAEALWPAADAGVVIVEFWVFVNLSFSPSRVTRAAAFINGYETRVDSALSGGLAHKGYTRVVAVGLAPPLASRRQNEFRFELETTGGLLPLQAYFCGPRLVQAVSGAAVAPAPTLVVVAVSLVWLML